jgi:hypothetical protein
MNNRRINRGVRREGRLIGRTAGVYESNPKRLNKPGQAKENGGVAKGL